MEKENNGWFARTLEKAREAVGLRASAPAVQAHSNRGVAVPEKDADKGAHLKTTNRLSPEELERNQQRHMKQHPEHQSAVSHNGQVREATTGRMYNRVGSEERVAKERGEVEKQREVKHRGMSL